MKRITTAVHASEYPRDWSLISARIIRRDGGKCSRCGVKNNSVIERLADGAFVLIHEAATYAEGKQEQTQRRNGPAESTLSSGYNALIAMVTQVISAMKTYFRRAQNVTSNRTITSIPLRVDRSRGQKKPSRFVSTPPSRRSWKAHRRMRKFRNREVIRSILEQHFTPGGPAEMLRKLTAELSTTQDLLDGCVREAEASVLREHELSQALADAKRWLQTAGRLPDTTPRY